MLCQEDPPCSVDLENIFFVLLILFICLGSTACVGSQKSAAIGVQSDQKWLKFSRRKKSIIHQYIKKPLYFVILKSFGFILEENHQKPKIRYTTLNKKTIVVYDTILSDRKTSTRASLKASVCFQQIHLKQYICLRFHTGRGLVFSMNVTATDVFAIGLREACETDLQKSLIRSCSLPTEAEMGMWTAWCVATFFFGASKASAVS